MKKTITFLLSITIISFALYFLISKQPANRIISEIEIYRFEQSLFSTSEQKIDNDILIWKKKLGSFFESFNLAVLRTNSKKEDYKNELLEFVSHSDMREAYDTLNGKYPDLDFLEKEMRDAFAIYAEYFPKKKIPTVITYFSGFNFGVVTNDTIVAIGLDYFLGKDCSFYKRLNSPEYMREFNQRKFIIPFCFEAIANNEFSQFNRKGDFLSEMLFKGKVMYFLDLILPEMSAVEKFRYSKPQFEWCEENENNIWTFFIEKDLLFSTEIKRFNSYLNYAPFAKGMPKESPGRVAYFIGWKIVKAYMENNPNSGLDALMKNTNAQEILQQSGYKP